MILTNKNRQFVITCMDFDEVLAYDIGILTINSVYILTLPI